MLPPQLTDLASGQPGLSRVLHGIGRLGPAAAARRVAAVGWEAARATVQDWLMRAPPARVLRRSEGSAPLGPVHRAALYVHYARSGRLTEMVRRQLAALAAEGFAIVLVTHAPAVPEAEWAAMRAAATVVLQRENRGLDFGGWRDAAAEAQARWPALDELLLANDSMLGPIHPLTPVVAALRSGGEGVFGLTQSAQGGAHLQSFFVLARGRGAIGDLIGFLRGVRTSRSKWLIVQRGELRLARAMRRRGHRVAALFGPDAVVAAAADRPAERAYLGSIDPRLRALDAMPGSEWAVAAAALLAEPPLNPTHQLWRALLSAGFPFIKTELVRRNPLRLPAIKAWPSLVPPDAPCPADIIAAHLREIG